MRALVVVLVVGLVALLGSAPASADAQGTKVFKGGCTLHMEGLRLNGPLTGFFVSDEGDGCGDYYLRSARLTTKTGSTSVVTLSRTRDGEDDPDLERFNVYGEASGFAYGQVNVFVPSKARCYRYRLSDDGSVRLVDAQPCSGNPYPPDTKRFVKDCAVVMDHSEVFETGRRAAGAHEVGSECGEYVLRGIGVVSTTGQHVAVGISDVDDDPDPDLENIYASVRGDIAYATLNVYIPYRARCDRFRYTPDRVMRYLESMPCSG